MKLLIFCPYYPPHVGGLESHADQFNKHLAARGIDIVVFTPHLPADAPEKEKRFEQVRVIRFPAFEIIYNYPLPKFWSPVFWRQLSELKKENYDLVISRTRFFFTSIMARRFARSKKIKWLHIEHGSDFVKLDSTWKSLAAKIYDHTLGKLVLCSSDANVANSLASAKFVNISCPKKPCSVIYRGVEVEKILAVKEDENLHQKYAGKIIIGYLGRLIDGKGVQDLLRSINILNNPNLVCFIIGAGQYRDKLEKLAQELNIKNQIVFFGHQNIDAAIAILKTADIVINPSYTEGLPTSVIEAALCQKPIIATNVGGTNEIITDKASGILVEPKQPKKLAEEIIKLIANPGLRKSIGEKASEEVKNKFSWEKSIERYEEIFSKLLEIKY